MLRLTREQVREIDRRAVEEYHIPSIVLMENAAHSFVIEIERGMPLEGRNIAIVCGGGNNGGDGFAIARHLHNRGARVVVAHSHHALRGDALTNWNVVEAMRIDRVEAVDLEEFSMFSQIDLLIDALFGTGLSRAVDQSTAKIISFMNSSAVPVIAVDVPSGLDCETGLPTGACVRATRTVTFVAEKAGFANPSSKQFTGEVIIGDIGCPRELIDDVARRTL